MQLDLQGQKLLMNSSSLERERWGTHINARTSLYRPNLSDKLITSNKIHKIKPNSLETWKHWICCLLDCFQIISKHIWRWYTLTNIVFPNCNKRTHTNISWGSYCICLKLYSLQTRWRIYWIKYRMANPLWSSGFSLYQRNSRDL